MAKTKAELMAEKLQQQQVGKAAFQAGNKPAVEPPAVTTEAFTATPAPADQDLMDFVSPVGTQGRKGEKCPRMNLAIPEDVYEYIRRESRRNGMTYSEFICAVMRQRANTQ